MKITAEEARSISKKNSSGGYVDIFLRKIYKKIKDSAELGDFSVTFKDHAFYPVLSSEVGRKLKNDGFSCYYNGMSEIIIEW